MESVFLKAESSDKLEEQIKDYIRDHQLCKIFNLIPLKKRIGPEQGQGHGFGMMMGAEEVIHALVIFQVDDQ